MQAEPWAALAEGGIPVTWITKNGTLNFLPDASEDVENVSIIGDGELSSCASSPTEKTDFVLGVEGYAMSKSWKGYITSCLERFCV